VFSVVTVVGANRLKIKKFSLFASFGRELYTSLFMALILQLCIVLVVVGMKAELLESSVDDVTETEDRIVSQWAEVSADEQHQLRERFDEILRPLGLQTRLLVVEKANSLALFFTCLTLSALMSLRDQWRSRRLRDIVQSLFRLLSGARYLSLKRLIWPVTDYERCVDFFTSQQSK